MKASTLIATSEAKAKLSELLKRTQQGERFNITLRGEEIARLVPAKRFSLEEIRNVIASMKSARSMRNPAGAPRLRIKDIISKGRR